MQERWTSIGLKPHFNDFVVNHGHAFGFDGSMLSCIDLADGKGKWKGGRYGHGRILLSEQSLLLVLSEEGDLWLVAGASINSPKWPASEPLPARRGIIQSSSATSYLCNGEEMAAFRLCRAWRRRREAHFGYVPQDGPSPHRLRYRQTVLSAVHDLEQTKASGW